MTPLPESTSLEPSLTIKLTNGAKSIAEIYYADGQKSLFSYRPTRIPLIGALLFVLLTGIFYALSISIDGFPVIVFTLSMLASVIFTGNFGLKANHYFEWRREVKKYLKEVESYKEWSLTLKEHTFEVVNEKETTIEKWKNIRKVSLSAARVQMTGENDAHYLFPAKAMDEKDYQALSQFVKEKVK